MSSNISQYARLFSSNVSSIATAAAEGKGPFGSDLAAPAARTLSTISLQLLASAAKLTFFVLFWDANGWSLRAEILLSGGFGGGRTPLGSGLTLQEDPEALLQSAIHLENSVLC